MTAAFKALLVVLSAPSAHAINVHPALQQDASRSDAHDEAADPLWPQLGEGNTKCENDQSKDPVESQAACQAKAVEAGVGYYQYDADEGYCWWFATCTSPTSGTAKNWKIYSQALEASEVSGTGDPHLRNLRGEHFDIYRPGVLPLLHVPRLAEPARTLLLVEADARRMSGVCSIYFQVVTISGMWTNESKPIQFLANPHGAPAGRNWKEWMRFGSIELKVAHQTKGVDYLNVYARNVSKNGYEVGGLLGLDDHSAFATRPRECAHQHAATLWSSVAAAL